MVNEDLVHAVEEKIRENRQFTITSLSLHFLKFHGHFFTKLSDKLKFWELCAHCVLKMLTEDHKLEHQGITLDFLTQYSEEGVNFLSHVVAENETWVSHEALKLKLQVMEWRNTSLSTKTKFKQTAST